MGVDIYGKAPRSEAGRYFAANWAAWHDLAKTCWRVAPDICSQVDERDWHCNYGRGLDDAGAIALADALDQAVNTDALRYEDALSGQPTPPTCSPRGRHGRPRRASTPARCAGSCRTSKPAAFPGSADP